MSRKQVLAIVAAVLLLGGWYAFRPERLFIDKTVNEPLVDAAAPAAPAAGGMMASSAGSGAMAAPAMAAHAAGEHSMAMSAASQTDPIAGSGTAEPPASVAAGQFHSNAHATHGDATIYRLSDGVEVLRLTSFETSNGPDVHVYLVAAADVNDNATVDRAGYVDLGVLKGNKGDQNYRLPRGLDVAKYRAATIWCKRFSVNFGTAPLHPAGALGATGTGDSRPAGD